jgi:hypothetical protein
VDCDLFGSAVATSGGLFRKWFEERSECRKEIVTLQSARRAKDTVMRSACLLSAKVVAGSCGAWGSPQTICDNSFAIELFEGDLCAPKKADMPVVQNRFSSAYKELTVEQKKSEGNKVVTDNLKADSIKADAVKKYGNEFQKN